MRIKPSVKEGVILAKLPRSSFIEFLINTTDEYATKCRSGDFASGRGFPLCLPNYCVEGDCYYYSDQKVPSQRSGPKGEHIGCRTRAPLPSLNSTGHFSTAKGLPDQSASDLRPAQIGISVEAFSHQERLRKLKMD